MGYVLPMIVSFRGKFAEPILQGRIVPKGFPANLAKVARRKLIMVDAAGVLEALSSPPGNRLERLKGDLAGKHSIRINDQWRIVFKVDRCGSRRRGNNRLSLGVCAWQRNFRRFIPAKSCGKNFSFRLS